MILLIFAVEVILAPQALRARANYNSVVIERNIFHFIWNMCSVL